MSQPEHPTIEPAVAPLTGGQTETTQKNPLQGRTIGLGVLFVVLVGVALYVFTVVPDQVETVTVPSQASEPVAAPARSRPAESDDAPPPFEAAQREQARTKAQEQLAVFVRRQLQLEDEMNVASWGAAELAAIKERANVADQQFLREEYAAALDEYRLAVAELDGLIEQGRDLVQSSIAAGFKALDERDADRAEAAFERAVSIAPGDTEAIRGRARAKTLPEVIALLRESERAELRGNLAGAADLIDEALKLDPDLAGVGQRQRNLRQAQADARYQAQLSSGFSALENKDFEAALLAFRGVLAMRPDDPMALSGQQQTERAKTLARIDALKASARAHEENEAWDRALSDYDEALAIDASLKFARDGKLEIRRRVRLITAMDRVLADPGLLSSDNEFQGAQAVLAEALDEIGAGAKFDTRRDRFETLLARATVPVPLVLISDAKTRVVVHHVGVIGTFDRHELRLRPGRYTITGSQDGCRDVRKEVLLESDLAPVEVRCEEKI